MASTLGSLAARLTNSTTGSNESNGWCSRMSCRRMAANKSSLPRRRCPRGGCGVNGGSRRCSRSGHLHQLHHAPSDRAGRECDTLRCTHSARAVTPSRISSARRSCGSALRCRRPATSSRTAWPRCRALEPLFDQPQHVVRLLLEQFDVAVARDAERRARQHVEAAEQFRQPGRRRRLPAG